jgi:uncharacterized membrane protein
MPNLAQYHPHIVHFVIALGIAGVVFRLVSLTGRAAWTRQAATVLLLVAAATSVAAVKSGTDAHGPVERVPGARDAVVEHEELGERARTILLIVAGLELLALATRRWVKIQKGLYLASGLGGLLAAYAIYEAAEHGGELVYSYAGGVGLRTGDTADVRRLLVAALYHQARTDRDGGQAEAAARLTDELALRVPEDPAVTFLAVESRLRDRKDPGSALADLAAMTLPPDQPRFVVRHGLLTAEALVASGRTDSARVILTGLAAQSPESPAIKEALERLSKP